HKALVVRVPAVREGGVGFEYSVRGCECLRKSRAKRKVCEAGAGGNNYGEKGANVVKGEKKGKCRHNREKESEQQEGGKEKKFLIECATHRVNKSVPEGGSCKCFAIGARKCEKWGRINFTQAHLKIYIYIYIYINPCWRLALALTGRWAPAVPTSRAGND
uniref:Uncharacterized protein n=1 Tax=Anopheles atroparvus TaxID=41427 RepID=A0AAG5CNV8_ANOAO